MYATYGGYTMSDANRNKVNLAAFDIIPQYSERGKKTSVIHRVTLRGELLIADGLTTAAQVQADLTTKIGALANAFVNNGLDFRFYQDDGTLTNHCLFNDNSAALTDVQIVQRSWPEGDPAEYATQRTYQVVLQQELADRESELLVYRETISLTGSAGRYVEWVENAAGIPIYQEIHANTMTQIVQQGEAIAMDGWPFLYIPEPIYGFPYERVKLRRLDLILPRFTGRQYVEYGCRWRYEYQVPIYARVVPNRPIL